MIFRDLSPELSTSVEALTNVISKVYNLAIVAGVMSLLGPLLMEHERLFGSRQRWGTLKGELPG
jgi:hypothetical protein